MATIQVLSAAIKFIHERITNYYGEVLHVLMFNELGGECTKIGEKATINCMNKYCSTCNLQILVDYIDQAQYSVDICIYTFTSPEIYRALQNALNRGVRVRVITDRELLVSHSTKILILKELGVVIRSPKSASTFHHKFMVLDGRERVRDLYKEARKNGKVKLKMFRTIVITGSANFTYQAFFGNWENCIISSDKKMTTEFGCEFERLWDAIQTVI